MTSLPNPFDSAAIVERPAEAPVVASSDLQASDVTAACSSILESSAAVAQDAVNVLVAGSNPASPATDCIGEIFVGARKLNLPRFKLDEERFMLDLEEPTLFLRQAV